MSNRIRIARSPVCAWFRRLPDPTEMPRIPLLGEVRPLGALAGPLIVAQVSQVGMGFTDTIMAGRLGALELGAVAIGSTLWIPVYLACLGVINSLAPLVAHRFGAGRTEAIAPLFRQSLWLALVLGVVVAWPLTRAIGGLMPLMQIDPQLVPVTDAYLDAISWGMPGACLFLSLRFASEGIGLTRPLMYIQLTGLAANALANYVLMYGALGIGGMGAVGAGWASAIVMWLDLGLMLLYVTFNPVLARLGLLNAWAWPNRGDQARLLSLGLPIAGAILIEVGMFSAVSLLMGRLGTEAVAAHQIALNYAALGFMIPLGISMAATVRVGQHLGAGRRAEARTAGLTAMALGVAAMACTAALMLVFPNQIIGLYTTEPGVARLAAGLLGIAALFQLSDGLQVTAMGALRGFKDTRLPMIVSFFSYWMVGVPLAWWLGIAGTQGPRGLWLGLVFGLSSAAILLSWRFRYQSRLDIPR
jgi:MATE family multidrug resistance protein